MPCWPATRLRMHGQVVDSQRPLELSKVTQEPTTLRRVSKPSSYFVVDARVNEPGQLPFIVERGYRRVIRPRDLASAVGEIFEDFKEVVFCREEVTCYSHFGD
jgi:hypothetical protein